MDSWIEDKLYSQWSPFDGNEGWPVSNPKLRKRRQCQRSSAIKPSGSYGQIEN